MFGFWPKQFVATSSLWDSVWCSRGLCFQKKVFLVFWNRTHFFFDSTWTVINGPSLDKFRWIATASDSNIVPDAWPEHSQIKVNYFLITHSAHSPSWHIRRGLPNPARRLSRDCINASSTAVEAAEGCFPCWWMGGPQNHASHPYKQYPYPIREPFSKFRKIVPLLGMRIENRFVKCQFNHHYFWVWKHCLCNRGGPCREGRSILAKETKMSRTIVMAD